MNDGMRFIELLAAGSIAQPGTGSPELWLGWTFAVSMVCCLLAYISLNQSARNRAARLRDSIQSIKKATAYSYAALAVIPVPTRTALISRSMPKPTVPPNNLKTACKAALEQTPKVKNNPDTVPILPTPPPDQPRKKTDRKKRKTDDAQTHAPTPKPAALDDEPEDDQPDESVPEKDLLTMALDELRVEIQDVYRTVLGKISGNYAIRRDTINIFFLQAAQQVSQHKYVTAFDMLSHLLIEVHSWLQAPAVHFCQRHGQNQTCPGPAHTIRLANEQFLLWKLAIRAHNYRAEAAFNLNLKDCAVKDWNVAGMMEERQETLVTIAMNYPFD